MLTYGHRSWAVATNLFWASVLSLTFPRMLGALGPPGGGLETLDTN